jgi:hypothetical protein
LKRVCVRTRQWAGAGVANPFIPVVADTPLESIPLAGVDNTGLAKRSELTGGAGIGGISHASRGRGFFMAEKFMLPP